MPATAARQIGKLLLDIRLFAERDPVTRAKLLEQIPVAEQQRALSCRNRRPLQCSDAGDRWESNVRAAEP